MEEALTDAYKRLLKPAIETEFAALSKEKADEEAIRVFAENLRQLLLAPPLVLLSLGVTFFSLLLPMFGDSYGLMLCSFSLLGIDRKTLYNKLKLYQIPQ